MSGLETAEIDYGAAILQATQQEMDRDPSVFVYGLGVDDPRGHYGTTKDLHERFGWERNFDMPLSEDALTGIGIGAALGGMRPIFVHQRMDFLMLCMNQLVNMAAKLRYMSNGRHSVPFVVRASIGRSWGQGAQHSQAFHSFFMHVPGIKVVAPTTPHDVKGALAAAIRDDNPVVFIEHRMLYANRGHVPVAPFTLPFGQARILRPGTDITLVGVSYTVVDCLRAATLLQEHGISAEVIDPVSLAPLDYETIRASARKTGRLLVVDNGWLPCGASAEILADLAEHGYSGVRAARMGYGFTPCPTTRVLEEEFYPTPQKVALRCYEMCGGDGGWHPAAVERSEIEAFKGPF